MRRAWNGVVGARFYALLHGVDLPDPETKRRSLGHQHVLAPEERSYDKASTVLRALLVCAAQRLRDEGFYAKRLVLDILWSGDLGCYADDMAFRETQDTRFFLGVLEKLWQGAPRFKPLRVGVTLADLVQSQAHQLDLFDDTVGKRAVSGGMKKTSPRLNAVLDQLNGKYGRGTVSFASAASDLKNERPPLLRWQRTRRQDRFPTRAGVEGILSFLLFPINHNLQL